MHHFLRKDYGTFRLFSGSTGNEVEGTIERTVAYIQDIVVHQGYYIAPLFAVLGALGWIWNTLDVCPRYLTSYQTQYTSIRSEIDTKITSKTIIDKKKKNKVIMSSVSNLDIDAPKESSNGSMEVNQKHTLNVRPSETAYFPVALLLSYVFYFAVFHSLSNLPLSDKLLFGVHQRFWMQPNVILFIWAGIGYDYICSSLFNFNNKSNVPNSNNNLKQYKTKDIDKKTKKYNTHDNHNEDVSNNSYVQDTNHSSNKSLLFNLSTISVSITFIAMQANKWWYSSDQSQSFYFRNYAHALLAPLPSSSLLLVNYDMQWTALRYVQMCENYRNDITTINLSMMTYKWFQYKHNLYPNIYFPGTYHAAPESLSIRKEKAFTMYQFVSSNIKKIPIFLSGKFSFKDPLFEDKFEQVPTGLVSALVLRTQVPNATVYYMNNKRHWEV